MLTTHLTPTDFPPEPGLPNAWQVPINYALHPGIRPCPVVFMPQRYTFPAATIVTPLYNTYELLHETAQSVFNQSMQQFEWIIIDDGNTSPEALDVMTELAAKDSRVRLVRHEHNRGVSAARNTAICAARTDYLLLLDSDDTIEPGTLEKLIWRMFTWPNIAFARGYSVGFAAHHYVLFAGFHMGKMFTRNNMANLSGTMLRPSRLQNVRYNEDTQTGLEDWEFWLHCAAEGIWGGSIYECCDWYRRRVTHTDRWEAYDPNKFDAFIQKMRRSFPSLWESDVAFPCTPPIPGWKDYESLSDASPCKNILVKRQRRIILLVDVLNAASRPWLGIVREFFARGQAVSIIAIGPGPHPLASAVYAITPEVFILSNFLDAPHYAAFISYLIVSRQADVLLAHGKLATAMVPYLALKHSISTAITSDTSKEFTKILHDAPWMEEINLSILPYAMHSVRPYPGLTQETAETILKDFLISSSDRYK